MKYHISELLAHLINQSIKDLHGDKELNSTVGSDIPGENEQIHPRYNFDSNIFSSTNHEEWLKGPVSTV